MYAPDAVRGEAGVEGEGALLGQGLDCAVHGPSIGHGAVREGLHLLHARLDEVKGEAEGCAHDTGAKSSTDNRCLVGRLVTEVLHKHLLDLQVRGMARSAVLAAYALGLPPHPGSKGGKYGAPGASGSIRALPGRWRRAFRC